MKRSLKLKFSLLLEQLMINIQSKSIHFFSALAFCIICLAISAIWRAELYDNVLTTFSAIGTFLTAYGLIFAIIELLRAKEASERVNAAAEKAFATVNSLVTAREIIECQNTIKNAMDSIDEKNWISGRSLQQILQLYSQIFHTQIADEKSKHRKNKSTLESYSYKFDPYTHDSSNLKNNITKIQKVLLSITSQLGELQGSTKNFTEYKK